VSSSIDSMLSVTELVELMDHSGTLNTLELTIPTITIQSLERIIISGSG